MQQARVRAAEGKVVTSGQAKSKQTDAAPRTTGSIASFGHADLTQEQIQLFASESSALTKTLQADLAAVESVTRTLNTVAELQATVVQHLTTQTDAIATLTDEAIDQQVAVQHGNVQLNQAKERTRSANRLLTALLVGSDFGLLFLHVVD